MLRVFNLTCHINDKTLYENINLKVTAGSCLQIVGGNGCGKTSLLKQLCGFIEAENAEFYWHQQPCQVREFNNELISCGHQCAIDERLSMHAYIQWARLFSNSPSNIDIEELLTIFGLQHQQNQMLSTLSAGQKKRLSLSRVLLSNAPLWLLDEPFNALDKMFVDQLLVIFSQHLNHNGAIIFTSHQAVDGHGFTPEILSLESV